MEASNPIAPISIKFIYNAFSLCLAAKLSQKLNGNTDLFIYLFICLLYFCHDIARFHYLFIYLFSSFPNETASLVRPSSMLELTMSCRIPLMNICLAMQPQQAI